MNFYIADVTNTCILLGCPRIYLNSHVLKSSNSTIIHTNKFRLRKSTYVLYMKILSLGYELSFVETLQHRKKARMR